MNDEKIEVLLTEIRDTQRQLLEEYRRVAGEALAIQKRSIEQQTAAVQAQAKHIRLYKIVLLVAAPIFAYLFWALAARL